MALQMIWTPHMTWMQICQVLLFLLQCWLTPIIRWVLRDVLSLWRGWWEGESNVLQLGLKVVRHRATLIVTLSFESTHCCGSNLIGMFYLLFFLSFFLTVMLVKVGVLFSLLLTIVPFVPKDNNKYLSCFKLRNVLQDLCVHLPKRTSLSNFLFLFIAFLLVFIHAAVQKQWLNDTVSSKNIILSSSLGNMYSKMNE